MGRYSIDVRYYVYIWVCVLFCMLNYMQQKQHEELFVLARRAAKKPQRFAFGECC